MKKDEMGGAYSTSEEMKGYAYKALIGKPKSKSHLKHPAVNWGIILEWMLE
jgi:hypothetical protein